MRLVAEKASWYIAYTLANCIGGRMGQLGGPQQVGPLELLLVIRFRAPERRRMSSQSRPGYRASSVGDQKSHRLLRLHHNHPE